MKNYISSVNFFGSFTRIFAIAFFKSKYGRFYHEVIQHLTMKATTSRYSGKPFLCKFPRKNIHCRVQFSKVVGQKREALINMELLLNVFLGILLKFLNCFLFKKNNYEKMLLALLNS